MKEMNLKNLTALLCLLLVMITGFGIAAENPLTGIDTTELTGARAQTGDANDAMNAGWLNLENMFYASASLATLWAILFIKVLSKRSKKKMSFMGNNSGKMSPVFSMLVFGLFLCTYIIAPAMAAENELTGIDSDDLDDVRENQTSDAQKSIDAGWFTIENIFYALMSFSMVIAIIAFWKVWTGQWEF